jgi:acetyl esterase
VPLHGFYVSRLHGLAGYDRERAARLDADTRRLIAYYRSPTDYDMPFGVEAEDISLEGRHGSIPMRRYRYRFDRGEAESARALLWVHGGGFSQGSLDWAESHVVAAELAARAHAEVVSVDYRLAVDGVRYPVPLDDVHDAALWLMAHVSSGVRVALGGASAGASLALAAAQRLCSADTAPEALLLAYPLVHFPVPALDDEAAEVVRAMPPMLRFPPAHIEATMRNYVGRLHDLPASAVPGNGHLRGLPPTHIHVAEYDELRPSGELLARQLAESGVPVTLELARGVPHGHLNRTPAAPQVDATLDAFAAALLTL